MKNTLPLLLAAFTCFSCNNTTTTTTTITTFDSTTTIVNAPDSRHELFVLDSTLKQFETPMQRFKASIISPAKITGAKGTIINVNAADLETVSGKPMGNHIDIELKELNTTGELARERAATVSDGKLLVSGGAYYINMTSGGEQLKLKQGKNLMVQLGVMTKDPMYLFYGRKDSLSKMNWEKSQLAFEIPGIADNKAPGQSGTATDTSREDINGRGFYQERVGDSRHEMVVYKEIAIQNFGWINCDHFLYDNAPLTNLTIDFDKTDTFNCIAAYLLFKDINCVMHYYFQTGQQNTFPNIPVGSKVDFIALALRQGKIFTSKAKILVSAGKQVTIKMKETPEAEISNIFKLK